MTVRSDIRAEYAAELANWTRLCQVHRFVSVVDATGREFGEFQPVAVDEPMWIQAVSRGAENVEEKGLDAKTTHMAFQYWDGFALDPLDKVYDTDEQGATHEYDVVRAHLKESHRVAELMLAKRNPD